MIITTRLSLFAFLLFAFNLTFGQVKTNNSATTTSKTQTPSPKPPLAGVKWYTVEEVVKLLPTKPKKVFIDVYTDWCGWCKRMDATTFDHPDIAKILNTEFYAVKFNAEQLDSMVLPFKTFHYIKNPNGGRGVHQFAYELLAGSMSYPTFAILDENFTPINRSPGYKTAEQIEPVLKFFSKNSYKTVSFDDFYKSFQTQIK